MSIKLCRSVPLLALLALASACSGRKNATDIGLVSDPPGGQGAVGGGRDEGGAGAAGGAAGIAGGAGMGGGNGAAGEWGNRGPVFIPGDCAHPDWPGLKICCGNPDEQPGSNCVPAAAVDHPCSDQGEFQDVKAFRVCCKGLTPIARVVSTNDDEDAGGAKCSEQLSMDPSRVCTHCADGKCGAGENACNCPEDCGAP